LQGILCELRVVQYPAGLLSPFGRREGVESAARLNACQIHSPAEMDGHHTVSAIASGRPVNCLLLTISGGETVFFRDFAAFLAIFAVSGRQMHRAFGSPACRDRQLHGAGDDPMTPDCLMHGAWDETRPPIVNCTVQEAIRRPRTASCTVHGTKLGLGLAHAQCRRRSLHVNRAHAWRWDEVIGLRSSIAPCRRFPQVLQASIARCRRRPQGLLASIARCRR